tara:strand:+ start:654 stop:920 length:267 start_codon:yes stop_codon:yes gene_type:complete
MKELRILKPSHRQAIRLIAAGLPVKDAAALIGISATFMSTVYRSDVGQDFALHLEEKADDYVACMIALGLVPEHICSAKSREAITGSA